MHTADYFLSMHPVGLLPDFEKTDLAETKHMFSWNLSELCWIIQQSLYLVVMRERSNIIVYLLWCTHVPMGPVTNHYLNLFENCIVMLSL